MTIMKCLWKTPLLNPSTLTHVLNILPILLCLRGETSGHFIFPPPQIFISSKGNSSLAPLLVMAQPEKKERRLTISISREEIWRNWSQKEKYFVRRVAGRKPQKTQRDAVWSSLILDWLIAMRADVKWTAAGCGLRPRGLRFCFERGALMHLSSAFFNAP
jgi:hypothetical protein